MGTTEPLSLQATVTLPEEKVTTGKLAGHLYGATIFFSAFLLFLVEPILAKIILPWFGGSAGVWTVCLVFFQTSLLGGYFYAHGIRRCLKPKGQMKIHLLLLAASVLLLPILPSPVWKLASHTDPAWRILGLLASTIGLPFLLISATSPLLQAWYVDFQPRALAYRFYALSNLGSLLGLLCFPLIVEPRLSSRTQALGWSAAYLVFALLCATTAWHAQRHRGRGLELFSDADVKAKFETPLNIQVRWVALAACGAGLLLAVTNHLSQNIAPIPLLWVLPLTIYLFSFVLCFDTERVYERVIWAPLLLIALGAIAFAIYYHEGNPNGKWAIPVFLTGLFVCCMVCHGELARAKPPTQFLTYFYLLVSTGGVLGGFFVALIAPHVFKTFAELPLLMVVCAGLLTVSLWNELKLPGRISPLLVRLVLVGFTLGLGAYMMVHQRAADSEAKLQLRNFYGILEVDEDGAPGSKDEMRIMVQGTIDHGAQMIHLALRREPTSYYLRSSGIGLALKFFQTRPPIRVGLIGLGAGVLATYGRAGDVYRFYEINPAVEKIARSQFTFLADSPATIEVLSGDARLTLESETPQHYDVLAVDAFSGDAIPLHLITREAFIEYFRHLKPDGILAIHISNRYLDLAPVVAGLAENLHKPAVLIDDPAEEGEDPAESEWVLLTSAPHVLDDPVFQVDYSYPAKPNPHLRLWTDDYSNLLQILHFVDDKDSD